MNKSMRIFIYGVPGVGKTHYSKILGKELGLIVSEADKVKRKARKNKSKAKHPFLYLGTCLAYKQFGDLSEENVIKGLLAVRRALNEAVDEEVKENDNLIMEGAFLDPQSIKIFGRTVLLVIRDEQKHKKQFLHHREKLFDFNGNEFKAGRMIQDYLISEATRLGTEIMVRG